MTKEEYIDYWIDTAHYDWSGAEEAFVAKRYLHCLFWAHLTLEKIAKAHWVKTHQENIPPRIHNIKWLLVQSNIDLGDNMMNFIEDFNEFQLEGRYPDYTQRIYKMCTKEFTSEQLKKVKEIKQCLIKML